MEEAVAGIFPKLQQNLPIHQQLGVVNALITDYLHHPEKLASQYSYKPKMASFEALISDRSTENVDRETLANVLLAQYEDLPKPAEEAMANIQHLKRPNTFTITTGHQLSFAGGPAFFLYKLLSIIKMCQDLSEKYTDKVFVPLFWMATEDHDLEEISSSSFPGRKYNWDYSGDAGAAGRILPDVEEEIQRLIKELGLTYYSKDVDRILSKAYKKGKTLTSSVRFMVNELVGKYGIVCLDADDRELKTLFREELKKELLENQAFKAHIKSEDFFARKYPLQVHPREINLFYLESNYRERLVKDGEGFATADGKHQWTSEELLGKLESEPECFSPNVVMRPVYQEKILPNLAYVGGPGELHYWLQLKPVFQQFEVFFPMLVLRDMAVLTSQKNGRHLEKLNLSLEKVIASAKNREEQEKELLNLSVPKELEELKEKHQLLGKELEAFVAQMDPTLRAGAEAAAKKVDKQFAKLYAKSRKALRQQGDIGLQRYEEVMGELFPEGVLQERKWSFWQWYAVFGENYISALLEEFSPLEGQLKVFNAY